jgi:hypothetical protein
MGQGHRAAGIGGQFIAVIWHIADARFCGLATPIKAGI